MVIMIARNIWYHSRMGQTQIIGAVLIFSIGVVMLTGIAFIFKSLKNNAVADIKSRTANEVLEYIAVKAAGLRSLNATYASTTFTIPEKLGGEWYTISSVEDETMWLKTYDFSANLTTNLRISGFADSSNGKVLLMYKNNAVTMRGVLD